MARQVQTDASATDFAQLIRDVRAANIETKREGEILPASAKMAETELFVRRNVKTGALVNRLVNGTAILFPVFAVNGASYLIK